jgi:dipeptide/tripeptide permease
VAVALILRLRGVFLTALGADETQIESSFCQGIRVAKGEVMVSITGLEFSYTQAPRKMKSAVMALWFFTVSVGNLTRPICRAKNRKRSQLLKQ